MIHRRTHPNLDVEGCFGCEVSSVKFSIPYWMRSENLDAVDDNKRDIEAAVRNDREGRFERAK